MFALRLKRMEIILSAGGPLAKACFKTGMSILSIFKMAAMTRSAFSVSLSHIISAAIAGTTYHDTPNLSFSHPHLDFFPPRESLSQK